MPRVTLDLDLLPDLPDVCVATGETADVVRVPFTIKWSTLSALSLLTVFFGALVSNVRTVELGVPLGAIARRRLLVFRVGSVLAFLVGLVGLGYAIFGDYDNSSWSTGAMLTPYVLPFLVMVVAWYGPRVHRWRLVRLSPKGETQCVLTIPSEGAARACEQLMESLGRGSP